MAAHASDAQTLMAYLRKLTEEDAERDAHATLTPSDRALSHYEHLLAAHLASKVDLDERWAAQSLRCGFENTPDRWLTSRINDFEHEETDLGKLHDRLRAAGILRGHESLDAIALPGHSDCPDYDEEEERERDTNGSSIRRNQQGDSQLLARDALPSSIRV